MMRLLNGWTPVALVFLLVMVVPCGAYPSGAPPGVCGTLMPVHGAVGQMASTNPYIISVSSNTFTPGGPPITVTLSAPNGTPVFKGFLLTTEYEGSTNQNDRPGTFTTIPPKTKILCTESAVTHSERNTLTSLSFEWTPPASSVGNIRFRTTFVQIKTTFWMNVKTAAGLLSDSTGTSNASTPAPSKPDPTVAPQAASLQNDPQCGSSKGCYSDCTSAGCSFLFTWAPGTTEAVEVQLSAAISGDGTGRYIALGLSLDKVMGDDSVMYCINQANGAFLSYNIPGGKNNELLTRPQDGLSNIKSEFKDGILSCSFLRKMKADNSTRRFALDRPYTLFYAAGPGSAAGTGFHETIPLISTRAASLVDFTAIVGGSTSFPLVKAHGSLMIVAWIFFASIGIVLARYFKDVWQDSTCFSQKIWFQIHRTCMLLAFCATVAAFVIIFVYVGGYSDIEGAIYQEAHPILGIIVTVLTVLNPIMAVCRPHPGTPNRPYFNWAHWLVGTGAHVLAVITIFFGLLLAKADAPKYIIYILAAYVGWQVLIQVLLELLRCVHSDEGPSQAYEMSDINGDPSKTVEKKEQSSTKLILLFTHVLVITGFTIALLIVLNMGRKMSI